MGGGSSVGDDGVDGRGAGEVGDQELDAGQPQPQPQMVGRRRGGGRGRSVNRVSESMGRLWAEIRGLELKRSKPVPVWAAVVVDHHGHDKLNSTCERVAAGEIFAKYGDYNYHPLMQNCKLGNSPSLICGNLKQSFQSNWPVSDIIITAIISPINSPHPPQEPAAVSNHILT